jgi:hypothetical protein
MEARKNEIDSAVLGRPVLELTAYDPCIDFPAFEREYIEREHPVYVMCKIPAESVGHIHSLEDYGFRFLEFQLRLRGSLLKTYDVSGYDYSYLPVEGGQDLEEVLAIAGSIFEHDRVSRDPFFARWSGVNVAGERYRRYVLRSMEEPNEFVYKLVNNATGEIAGFGTHRRTAPESALLLIGGVKNQHKTSGLGAINDYFGLNELKRNGAKWFYTHVSGANYPILNLEVKGLGFRVVQSFVTLRKAYEG